MTTTMTRSVAEEMARAAHELRVTASIHSTDFAPTNSDGTYTGEILKRYSVVLRISDPSTGNGCVREFREPGDVTAAVADMRRQIKSLAKQTKVRIRAERSAS